MPDLLTMATERKQERARLVQEARDILDKKETTDEDSAKFDTLHERADELLKEAERFERQAEIEDRMDDVPPPKSGGPDPRGSDDDDPGRVEIRHRVLRDGDPRLAGGVPALERVYAAEEGTSDRALDDLFRRSQSEYRSAFRSYLAGRRLSDAEERALSMDTNTEGGYTVAPVQFVADLIRAVDDMVLIRPLATVIQVPSAHSLGVPSLDADPADADWTSELATGTEDSTMDFGDRELRPWPLAKRIKVSKKLGRASPLNIDALVRDRLGYKFGITQEKGFLTGSGANQPLGVFTASSNGISTSRDVSTGNTSTSIQTDGLIEAKYSLKMPYWDAARWMFHRDGVKQIAKLKDGEGQYLWRESVRAGEPDRLLGLPIFASEYVPSTFTASQYVGILGDFSFYWIAEALDMTVQFLAELYAESNQNGYIGRMEVDGMPVLEEAFARVKLAA